MLAGLTGSQLFAIEESEAEKLAAATARVLRHYDIEGPDEKIVDHFNLAMVVTTVYGTRLVASFADARTKRAQAAAARREERPDVQTVAPGNSGNAPPADPFGPMAPGITVIPAPLN